VEEKKEVQETVEATAVEGKTSPKNLLHQEQKCMIRETLSFVSDIRTTVSKVINEI
jgi:hypothetical protein